MGHRVLGALRERAPYIAARLSERSTYEGFFVVAGAVGAAISPDQQAAIATAGVAVAGLIRMAFPDPRSPQ